MLVVGDTDSDPLAKVDTNVPGEILTLAAPVVTQFKVVLAPGEMLVAPGVKELMVGNAAAASTVMLAVALTEPAAFVAVSVYVVSEAGVTDSDPLAKVDVNAPGAMLTLVAPFVTQFKVVLAPGGTVVAPAVKELMVGNAAAAVCTAMLVVAVTDPASLVAVSV